MRRRRSLLLTSVLALTAGPALIVGGASTASAAEGDGGDKASMIAEAEFRVYILTNTDFVPTDVTCTLPPAWDAQGDILCYALVSERDTIAAVATLEPSGDYSFVAVRKADVVDEPATAPGSTTESPDGPTTPGEPSGADAAVLASVAYALDDVDEITDILMEREPNITRVGNFTFDRPTGTLHIDIATAGGAESDRDVIAFSVTDTIAFLWEAETTFRAAGATIQPRLEVMVDDDLYSTPYAVMVDVADYNIGYNEWLDIVTTATPLRNRAGKDATAAAGRAVADSAKPSFTRAVADSAKPTFLRVGP